MTDLVRAHLALERVKVAIAQLQSARSEISVVAGEQRAAVSHADAALLEARRTYADIEAVIRYLARVL